MDVIRASYCHFAIEERELKNLHDGYDHNSQHIFIVEKDSFLPRIPLKQLHLSCIKLFSISHTKLVRYSSFFSFCEMLVIKISFRSRLDLLAMLTEGAVRRDGGSAAIDLSP